MMTNTKLLNAALSYASKGWHIFPVTPNQKIPYGSLVSKGHLNATTSACLSSGFLEPMAA